MPAAIIAESLNCSDSARLSGFGNEESFEKGGQATVGTVAELGKQLTIVLEVGAQDLRQGKNILTMGDRIEDVATQQITELDDLLGVATRAEPAPLATEREQVLVTAIGTAHTSEPFTQIASFQVITNHIIDTHETVSVGLDTLTLDTPLACLVMRIEKFPQRRLLRLPRVVNGRTVSNFCYTSISAPFRCRN